MSKEFEIKITEKLVRKVTIELDDDATENEALAKIEDKYWEGYIVLTADDYDTVEFEVV